MVNKPDTSRVKMGTGSIIKVCHYHVSEWQWQA